MTPQIRLELQRLLSALCDQEITDAEFARLEELLHADVESRLLYLSYMDMHSRLVMEPHRIGSMSAMSRDESKQATGNTAARSTNPDFLATPASRPGEKGEDRTWIRRNMHQAMLVLATLAASLLVQVLWRQLESSPGSTPVAAPAQKGGVLPERKATYVATLIKAVDCVWENPRDNWQNGSRLSAGKFRLAKGIASIRFDSGPELIVEGPAELNLESTTAVTVRAGKVVFRKDNEDASFDLRTPNSTLVDIGTEFAVSVSPNGEEVHVFDGEVQRVAKTAANGKRPEQLKAGEARQYEAASNARGHEVKLDPNLFVRKLDKVIPVNPAAGLLAYEGFAYSNAQQLRNDKANGGNGWVGPWKLGFAKPAHKGDLPLNAKKSLERSDAAVPPVGGSFDYTGFSSSFRKLAHPIALDADGVYYLSFLFRRMGPSADPINTVAVRFWTDDDYQHKNFQDFRKRLAIGVKGSNQLYTGLQRMAAQTSMPLSSGTTYLLVAKIAASRSKPDQVFLRVYGPEELIESDETGAWSLQSSLFRSEQVFVWMELHINSKTRQTIDEIRLGTTWASVASPWSGRN